MLYARLFVDAPLTLPDPPAGSALRRMGVEFYHIDGGVSRDGETASDFADRVAQTLKMAQYLYAADSLGRWAVCQKYPGEPWSPWEACEEPMSD